ncbi:lysophospholipid acyltransferase family protein [Piscinibacterium candidicorallinum]|uniref:Lysophospholipid acyltransferase family protein n=1 Tax=Piscinibacterium candidicorallinum TaxID=1793872 RepID=A0ABV7H9G3_9BURK
MLLVARLLAFLPLSLLRGLGALLGLLVWASSGGTRRLTEANLAQAQPLTAGLSARAVLQETGRSLIEMLWVWLRPGGDVLSRVHCADRSVVDAALAQGKGVLLITPHMGCFEVAAQWLAKTYGEVAPITVLYRPPRKAWVKPLVEDARQREHLNLAPAELRGVRLMLKALKRKELVGMLPDQVPAMGEGVIAPFFGRPAYTMVLPGKLALNTGAPVVMAIALRRPGGWDLRFAPFTGQFIGEDAADAATMNRAVEDMVALDPIQYLWAYNRYRMPDGALAAASAPAQATAPTDGAGT